MRGNPGEPEVKTSDDLNSSLLKALDASSGERHMQTFFKENPFLIYQHTVPCRAHDDYVIPEFEIGNEYKADFVVLNSYSGGWEITLIELEPVGESSSIVIGRRLANCARRFGR